MVVKIKKTSALDLTIRGSKGTFAVGGTPSGSSIRVHFLQTHVRFTLQGDQEEKLIKSLAPFREVFTLQDLDFEQIMQRDIDDARVATDLIPYLLEESSTGLVKLFPPIIVAVLPVNEQKLPADHYPRVTQGEQRDADGNPFAFIRSGDVGSEVFEFEQLVIDGIPQDHDYASLKLNTSKSALVIVDGQHRAMALIALYRNSTKWPDNARSVEPYYRLWSREVLAKYDLSEVKLPVMLCVFPELDGSQEGLMKVHHACRAVFLALNKNARKVTRARNFLLDDRDVVSSFMREVLTEIKARPTYTTTLSLRLWNVELDADTDNNALGSVVAITGVTHLYGMIERIMLRANPGTRLSAASKGTRQTILDACFRRLQVLDDLPKSVRDDSRRDTCTSSTIHVLTSAFRERFGGLIVKGLNDFLPYLANNQAAIEIYQELSVGATSEFYRTILFEGQNLNQVFEAHVEWLKKEVKSPDRNTAVELRAEKKAFDDREEELASWRRKLIDRRLEIMLGKNPEHIKANADVRQVLLDIYENKFITSAFQSAIFVTFFAAIDTLNEQRSKPPETGETLSQSDVDGIFAEYINQLNGTFSAKDLTALTRLVAVFHGPMVTDDDGVRISRFSETLRDILIPGELKPDEWPKFRYMILELWRPKNKELAAQIDHIRGSMRKQVLGNYVARKSRGLAASLAKRELSPNEASSVRAECVKNMTAGLKTLCDLSDKAADKLAIELSRLVEEPEEIDSAADPDA